MRKKNYLRLAIILVCLFMPLILISTARAIPHPDDDPSVYNLHVNRNLFTSGDALFYGQYLLPYADPPDTLADDAFIIRLIDTDNVTELGAVTPYAFFDNGYNYGAFGIYIESGIVWDANYTLRISESPAQFDEPASVDHVIQASVYSSRITQEDNKLELAVNILDIAQNLEQHYTDYALVEASAAGTVLSAPTGENYFRAAIPGIQSMAPSLFLVQIVSLDYTAENWTMERFETYEERFEETWVGTSANATASQFGFTVQTAMALIAIMPASIGAIILSHKKWRKAEPGFIVATVLLIMAVVMGWLPKAIFAAIFQLMGIYIAYLWFYARG